MVSGTQIYHWVQWHLFYPNFLKIEIKSNLCLIVHKNIPGLGTNFIARVLHGACGQCHTKSFYPMGPLLLNICSNLRHSNVKRESKGNVETGSAMLNHLDSAQNLGQWQFAMDYIGVDPGELDFLDLSKQTYSLSPLPKRVEKQFKK